MNCICNYSYFLYWLYIRLESGMRCYTKSTIFRLYPFLEIYDDVSTWFPYFSILCWSLISVFIILVLVLIYIWLTLQLLAVFFSSMSGNFSQFHSNFHITVYFHKHNHQHIVMAMQNEMQYIVKQMDSIIFNNTLLFVIWLKKHFQHHIYLVWHNSHFTLYFNLSSST